MNIEGIEASQEHNDQNSAAQKSINGRLCNNYLIIYKTKSQSYIVCRKQQWKLKITHGVSLVNRKLSQKSDFPFKRVQVIFLN